jgi:hypothetical protein
MNNLPERPNNDGAKPIDTNPLANGGQLLTLIANVRKDWDTVVELTEHQGKMIYAKFEAAKLAGFSEMQALEVCTKPWM